MKKLFLVGLLLSTQVTVSRPQASDIDRTYFYDQGISSCDILIFEKWLELGQDRDEIGDLISQALGMHQNDILGDNIDDKIEHWDYQLRTDLALPSLIKNYDYRPYTFLLNDLDRIDQLCTKINRSIKSFDRAYENILNQLKKYRLKIVKLFEYAVKIGVDINTQDKWGDTALIQAIHYNNLEFVQLCIRASADVNVKGNADFNQAPFVHAMFALDLESFENSSVFDLSSGLFDNNIEIVMALIHAGADVTVQDAAHDSALDYLYMLMSSLDETIYYCLDRWTSVSDLDEIVFGSFDLKRFNLFAFKAHVMMRYEELLKVLQLKMFGYDGK